MSSIFDYATYALMLWGFACWNYKFSGTSDSMKVYYEHLFHTGWFVESLLTQTLIVHIIRTRKIPIFQSRSSPILAFTTITVMGIGAWLPFSPFASYLGFVPLPPTFWIWIAAFLMIYCTLTHRVKVWFYNKFGVD